MRSYCRDCVRPACRVPARYHSEPALRGANPVLLAISYAARPSVSTPVGPRRIACLGLGFHHGLVASPLGVVYVDAPAIHTDEVREEGFWEQPHDQVADVR